MIARYCIAFSGLFLLILISQSEAQFRTFQTTTEEVTYTERKLTNGTTVIETIINTIVVDLTPNPITSQSAVKTEEKNQTLFLTEAAAEELKTAIASAQESSSSATVVSATVESTVDDTDKAQDTSGNVLETINYVEIVDGNIQFGNSDSGTVEEETVSVTQRAEFDTIVEEVKAIVSQN